MNENEMGFFFYGFQTVCLLNLKVILINKRPAFISTEITLCTSLSRVYIYIYTLKIYRIKS